MGLFAVFLTYIGIYMQELAGVIKVILYGKFELGQLSVVEDDSDL